VAIGVLVTLRLRYPSGTPEPTTVAALMTNPAASPVVGRPAQLTGKAIGRANPGFIAGEDVIYQDKTGLLTADFRSMLGFIGDLFAGWKRVPKHLGQDGQLQGWFRRGMGGYIVMKELTSTAGVLRARPYFWQAALSILVIAVTVVFILAGGEKIAGQFGDNTPTEMDSSETTDASESGEGTEGPQDGESTETPQPQE
jgi:hypothetical protein